MKITLIPLILVVAVVVNLQAASIHEVIEQGDSAAVVAMLDANPALLDERLPNGRSPLHTAAYNGKLNIVKLLVSRGADANAKTTAGAGPLHGAALNGHEAVVAFLVAHGANPNLANQAGYTPISNAAGSRSLPILKCLIEAGADFNPKSDSVIAPIATAANRSWLEGIEYLLDRGVDANAMVGDNGNLVAATVLNARWKMEGSEKAPEILRLLLKHGGNPNYSPANGFTALMTAAGADDTTLLMILLDAGADPNAKTLIGTTAFSSAVSTNCVNAARYLISRKAVALSTEVSSGRTTLHDAVMLGSQPMMDVVLSANPELNAVDSLGYTPLDLALRYGHKQIAAMLKTKGAITKAPQRDRLSSEYLTQKPAEGEAYLWYLGNCGYLIKTRNHSLVFDYWHGMAVPTEPSMANGFVNSAELASEDVTVFVTHGHADHFDSTIFGWAKQMPGTQYVFGFRPESLDVRMAQGYAGQPYEYVGPGMTNFVDGMKIFAVRSNDAGVGYVVSVDGVTIFHAGDLAGWLPDQKSEFTSQIDSIDAIYDVVDIALVNVTGCHHQDTVALAEGTAYTIDKLQPKLIVPTHAMGREQYYQQFMNKFAGQYPGLQSFCPMGRGDVARFTGGRKAAKIEVL